jgi:carbamate kinase
MRIVAALGGNALLRRGEALDGPTQERNVAVAARALARLGEEHDLIVTHDNGPQVGLLALQAAVAGGDWGFDVLGAESEGMIGYLIERELAPRLPHKRVVSLLTLVEVGADDPAFGDPIKPVGPLYDAAAAAAVRRQRGWVLKPEGDGWRRVVPSPLWKTGRSATRWRRGSSLFAPAAAVARSRFCRMGQYAAWKRSSTRTAVRRCWRLKPGPMRFCC